MKVSWRKGECREEIKLIAEASGMAFDEARIVVREGQILVEVSYMYIQHEHYSIRLSVLLSPNECVARPHNI